MNKGRDTFEQLMTIPRMMRVLHRKQCGGHGPAADPTRGAGRVLALLKLQDGVPTKEMAHILGIRVTSLNETLARMERDGLVERVPSDEDKRVLLVKLTDKGREGGEAQVDLPSRLMAGFADEELDAFSGYLERVIKAIEDEAGEDARTMIEESRRHREEFFKRAGHGHHGHGHGPGPEVADFVDGHAEFLEGHGEFIRTHGIENAYGPAEGHGHHGPHGHGHGGHGPGDGACCHHRGHGFGHHGRGMGGHGFKDRDEGWWA